MLACQRGFPPPAPAPHRGEGLGFWAWLGRGRTGNVSVIASMSILLLEMARRARLEDLVQERLSRSEPTPSGGWGAHVKTCQSMSKPNQCCQR